MHMWACIGYNDHVDATVSGYGIFATTDFSPGDFLLEYVGDLIDPSAADEIGDQEYIYYFSLGSKKYRLVNDMLCLIRLLY